MIPYDTDPSLHDHEPGPAVLDDGFSPPAAVHELDDVREAPVRSVPPPAGVRES